MLTNKLAQAWAIPPTWLRFIIAILLLLSVFFRFVNLDQKVYWFDETFTSIRISGYKEIEVVKQFANARIVDLESLQKYQRINTEKGVLDTIESLAIEDSQHPPIYYVMARIWAQWFGSSVAVMRSLPAVISLLALPCIYWLCLELFKSSLTGWVAVSLLAVSPFQVLYAQEARQYSLWVVTILLSSAALLRAMRLQTVMSWGIYTLILVTSFYTFLFSVMVAIGQGIYVIVTEGFRLSKTLINYLIASLVSIIIFLPWLWVVVINRTQSESSTNWIVSTKLSLPKLVQIWIHNLTISFFDLNLGASNSSTILEKIISKLADLTFLVLIGYALYFLYSRTPKTIWLFVFTLIVTPSIALMSPDIISGGMRSVIPRYGIPSYLGIQLAIAYLLANKIIESNPKQKLWQIALVSLLSAGVLSCAVISQSEGWWNKTVGEIREVARITNEAKSPLLIGSPTVGDILSLSHLLNSKTKFLIQPECIICRSDSKAENNSIPKIPEGFSDVLLYKSGSFKKWQQELEKNRNYQVAPITINAQAIPVFKVKKQ